ncbi:hypothetical protein V499_06591 [Pseudogymnoascus sp. VKM F-103]|nr:hypothetical protein V499_06591 [Pseudogymnoascus sp. VKM F-103]
MSSTNSRSQPKLLVNLPCKECRRAKQKCDRVSPACNRCVKRGSNCVFPQSRGVRDSPAASQQRELSPSVELQVIKEERQFLSVSNATSTMNSTTFSPLSNPLRDLQGRVASLFGSVPASWGSKLGTAQPELTKPRALRSNNANPVDLSLSKSQKSNNVLIPAVQAYNVERSQTPPRKRSDAQQFPASPATPRLGKPKHPLYKRLRASTRVRRKSRKLADAEVERIDCECGATEEGLQPEHWISCEKCKVWQHSACVKFSCTRCTHMVAQDQEQSASTQTDASVDKSMVQLQTQLDGANHEIYSLRSQLAEHRVNEHEQTETIASLKTDNDLLLDVQRELTKHHDWSSDDLSTHHHQVRKALHRQIRSQNFLGTFTQLSSTSSRRSTTEQLETGIRKVFWLTQQTFCPYGNIKTPFIQSLGQHETLRVLVCKVLGLHDSGTYLLDKARRLLSKLSIQPAMRALTGAAVREWVFESDIPIFEAGRGLQYYRECLRGNRDGAVTLRNWDLAALSKCVKSKEFLEEFIPQQAETLAIQLSNALAPFFSDTEDDSPLLDWDGFSTWGEGLEQWKERRRSFVAIFTAALTTKVELCLNIENYELLTYVPGTKFDETTMKVEAMDGSMDITQSHQGRAIQLCVEAAFFIHPRGELPMGATIEEAIVPMVNFISRDQNDKRVFKPLLKAVVILFEDD